jgi:hypothetical protein
MLFNSYEFLFLFLPIVLIVFSAIGIRGHHRVTITWLVAASLFFYGWWNLAYLGLIVFSMFFNYAIGVALSSDVNNRKRLKLIFGVAANLGLLGYFKYANFFVSNLNALAYHGVLAPNHRWRGLVTPAKRGKGAMRPADSDVVSSIQRHAAMTWAQRLKRVFNIDIEVCGHCGGSVKVIACIDDQDVIHRILAHLRETEKEAPARPLLVPPTRAPPATLSLFAGTEFHQQGRH